MNTDAYRNVLMLRKADSDFSQNFVCLWADGHYPRYRTELDSTTTNLFVCNILQNMTGNMGVQMNDVKCMMIKCMKEMENSIKSSLIL